MAKKVPVRTKDSIDISTPVDESTIYGGGAFTQINADDLINNKIAIQQLFNNYNSVNKESKCKDVEIQKFKLEILFLKSSVFVSIMALIINLIGTVLVGIGINIITASSSDCNNKNFAYLSLILGGILIFIGSIANILYPYLPKYLKSNFKTN